MASQPGDERAGRLSPDEAFAALGNETRVKILQSLWEADCPLAYTDLKDGVGIQNSGQFNYHLDKLTGHFIQRIDDGYELRMAGEQVITAVISGMLTDDPEFGPVTLDGSCPHCGEAVVADYRDETLTIWCTSEEGHIPSSSQPGVLAEGQFPPAGLVNRTPDEVARAAMKFGGFQISSMFEGVCPRCAGPVAHMLDVCDNHDGGRGRVCENCDAVFAVWSRRLCDVCELDWRVPAWHHLLRHPAVAGFFYGHGVMTISWTWELLTADVVRPIEETLDGDPFRLTFTFEVDGDERDVVLDEQLNVITVQGGQ